MNIIEFLADLQGRGVKVSTDGFQLRCEARPNTLTPELKHHLQTRKNEIIGFLAGGNQQNSKAIVSVSRDRDLPVSFAQQRLWFIDQLEAHSPLYNMPTALRFIGQMDISVFERALREIVHRHEILRTNFVIVNGNPVQKIKPFLDLTLPIIDLRSLSSEKIELEVRRWVSEEAEHPFNLMQEPLIRAKLLVLGEGKYKGEKEYILLFTLHHIVSDGWSEDILIREFMALYEAFLHGNSSPLARLPIQYSDYAVWQREWLQGAVLEQLLAYWKSQLADAPSILELPTDYPRPSVQSYRGKTHKFAINKALALQLQELSLCQGVTLFMTLLAAFNILLSRYSGQQDICIGTPVANRTRTEVEGLIGFFVNTLVLRTKLSGDLCFSEFLQREREVCLGAQSHQDLPFEKLVEELQPVRDMSHNPVFQVMFVLQNAPSRELKLTGLRMNSVNIESQAAKFDLTLEIAEQGDSLLGAFEYSTDLFNSKTIERMGTHFQCLLENIVAHPEKRLGDLSLLTNNESQQVLAEWNNTKTSFPVNNCLQQLFETQVELNPNAVAIVFENRSYTYAEINIAANRIAHYLCNIGAGVESIIGICAHRSTELIVGLLGIMKAGAAYLPLDPDYPQERLSILAKDAGLRWILVQPECADVLPPSNAQLIRLDRQLSEFVLSSADNPVINVAPDQLAYVLYTSGSTGRPKAVGVPHKGLLNRLLWMQERFDLSDADAVLQKTPYSFDVSVWEFFWPLIVGARLIVAGPNDHKDPERLISLIETHSVTTIHFVPSMLRVFLGGCRIMPH